MDFQPLESILKESLSPKHHAFVEKLLFGPTLVRELALSGVSSSTLVDLEVKGFSFIKESEGKNKGSVPSPVRVRVALFQNAIMKATNCSVSEQRDALLELGSEVISIAANNQVQIFCFQECWNMPIVFCTQKKLPWVEFAEDAYEGPTTKMLCELAKRYNMVIISPILERDGDSLWNSAVVINNYGQVQGVSRKNHIPISGVYGETYYYNPSEIGHPVFQTEFGRVAVAICYDRHHPQCFFSYALNQAEILFNPSASVKSFGESLWGIEARDAGTQNGYYVAAINRVGTERFDKGVETGPFFGSSYIAAPDGSRTPGLGLDKAGLLIADLDLNQCSNKEQMQRLSIQDLYKK